MLPQAGLYPLAWGAAALLWALCGARALRGSLRAGGRVTVAGVVLLALVPVAAVVGARAHFLLLAPDLLADGLAVWVSPRMADGYALRISGGLLAAAAVLAVAGPLCLRPASRWQILDRLVPPAGGAIAVGRLGCLADGCCFGVTCTLPWCVSFPARSPAHWSHVGQGWIAESAPASLAVHPLQVYLGVAGLVAWALSRAATRRHARDGTATLLFVLVLASSRLGLEPLRDGAFGGGVAHQGSLSAVCALFATVALAWRTQPGRRASSRSVVSTTVTSSRAGMPRAWISRAASPSSKRGR